MIYKINEAFLPCIFNCDYTSDALTAEDIENLDGFPVDLSMFSVFELDNGEFLTDFTYCDICHSLAQCVILYDGMDDIESIKQMYFFLDC